MMVKSKEYQNPKNCTYTIESCCALHKASIDNPVQQRASLQAVLLLTSSSASPAITRGCPKKCPLVRMFWSFNRMDSLFLKILSQTPRAITDNQWRRSTLMGVNRIYPRMLSSYGCPSCPPSPYLSIDTRFFSQVFNRKLVVPTFPCGRSTKGLPSSGF